MTMSSCDKNHGLVSDTRTIIKIISNEHRYSIMELLIGTSRDLCVHEISEKVGISQSATSHQLSYLEACGVVESVRAGKTKCYLPTDSSMVKKIGRVIDSLK